MFTGNYASIMKVFTKTVEKLNARAKVLDNQIQVRDVQIQTLNMEQADDRSEMAKCVVTSKKITDEFLI